MVEALYAESSAMAYGVKAILIALQGGKPQDIQDAFNAMNDAWWPSKARLIARAEEAAPVIEQELARDIGVVAREEDAASPMDGLRGGFWNDEGANEGADDNDWSDDDDRDVR